MMVRWKSDLVNTKESILLACDKPYHTNKRMVQKGEEIEVWRNRALSAQAQNVWLPSVMCLMVIYMSVWLGERSSCPPGPSAQTESQTPWDDPCPSSSHGHTSWLWRFGAVGESSLLLYTCSCTFLFRVNRVMKL